MKNSALYAPGLSTLLCLPGNDSRPGSGFNATKIEKYKRAIFLFFFLLATAPAFSQFAAWTGNKNSDWFDPANWGEE